MIEMVRENNIVDVSEKLVRTRMGNKYETGKKVGYSYF